MDHKPMRGIEPLEPPTPDLAQSYLDEIDVIERRRDERIDRRTAGWQLAFNGLGVAVVLTAYLLVVRGSDGAMALQPMLFLLILWGQIGVGVAERSGVRWRTSGKRPWQVIVVILLAIVAVCSFMVLLIDSAERPLWAFFVPGAIVAIGFGGPAAVQFLRSRGRAAVIELPYEPMPRASRLATAGLGLLLGLAVLAVGYGSTLFASVGSTILMFAMVAWILASRTDAGPQALGRFWRWPQILAYLLGVAVVIGLSLLEVYTDVMQSWMIGLCAVLVVLLLAGAAFLPDAGARRAADGRDG